MSAAANQNHSEETSCCNCGIVFSVPHGFLAERRRTSGNFYCPNGHSLHYPKKREEDAKDRTIENLRAMIHESNAVAASERERATAAENRTRSVRGHVTRLRKRLADGRCPCCSKAFPDVAAHIAEKHPRYRGDDTPA